MSTAVAASLSAASSWYHITVTSDGAVATAAASSETGNLPAFNAAAPVVVLADISTDAAGKLASVYDTRVFTTSTKVFATVASAIPLGTIVKQTATAGLVQAAVMGDSGLRGVVMASGGSQVIIATAGPVFVKAAGTTTAGAVLSPSLISGYAGAGTSSALYGNIGIGQLNTSNSCDAASTCQYSQLLELNIR
jgi:hypothetical protein